jgi:phage anti-repressor protein
MTMFKNNSRGRQARKYFIKREKRLKAARGTISAREAEKLRQQAKRLDITGAKLA